MSQAEAEGPATVLSTADPGLLAVAQSILDAAGIEFFARGDTARLVPPYHGWVDVQVAASDAAAARELLADLTR